MLNMKIVFMIVLVVVQVLLNLIGHLHMPPQLEPNQKKLLTLHHLLVDHALHLVKHLLTKRINMIDTCDEFLMKIIG